MSRRSDIEFVRAQKATADREFCRVDIGSPTQIGQPEQTVSVVAPSPAGWRLVSVTDAPIHILAIYLFMSLVLPASLLAITDHWPDYYRYEEFSLVQGVMVFSVIALVCFLRHIQWSQARQVAVIRQEIFIYSAQKLRIAGLIIAIGVALINIGNSGWRYDEASLSERGSFSLYFYTVIPACVKLLLIYHVFVYRGSSLMDRLERALVTAALAASINGNATAFVAVFSFIFLQTNARDYLFKSTLGATSYLRVIFLGGVIILGAGTVAMILSGAYIYGESVKRGESVDLVFEALAATWTPDILIERMSPPWVSLLNTLPLTFDFDHDGFPELTGVWNNFLFRLEALQLFQFGVDRGDAVSIMRLNYETIDIFALNPREGTAPGLIPGFLYCFPPLLNLAMLGAFVFMVLGMLQRLCMCMNDEMSFIGKFVLAYFTLPLFESPVDLLMIIDDGFIFFVGLWWMGKLVRSIHLTSVTDWELQPDAK